MDIDITHILKEIDYILKSKQYSDKILKKATLILEKLVYAKENKTIDNDVIILLYDFQYYIDCYIDLELLSYVSDNHIDINIIDKYTDISISTSSSESLSFDLGKLNETLNNDTELLLNSLSNSN